MPVHIDHIDTEIELTPSARRGEPRSMPAQQGAGPPTIAPSSLRDAVMCVLEAELEHYLRMRG